MVEQTAENITGAYDLVEVGFRILSLSLEDTMKKALNRSYKTIILLEEKSIKLTLPKLKKVWAMSLISISLMTKGS